MSSDMSVEADPDTGTGDDGVSYQSERDTPSRKPDLQRLLSLARALSGSALPPIVDFRRRDKATKAEEKAAIRPAAH